MRFVERSILLAVASVAGLGCGPRPPVIEPGPNGPVIRNAKTGLYTKEVMTKQAPDTFYAPDGTFCRVPADRYRDTAIHAMVYCNWQ